jgi:hypothetical protein
MKERCESGCTAFFINQNEEWFIKDDAKAVPWNESVTTNLASMKNGAILLLKDKHNLHHVS